MAKKDQNVDIVPRGSPVINGSPSIWYVAGVCILGWVIYKSGYDTGVNVSRKILRRHDKDVRRMKRDAAKREKQLRKELSPETETDNKWKWWPW